MDETDNRLLPCPFCGAVPQKAVMVMRGSRREYAVVDHRSGCFFLAAGAPVREQHVPRDAWGPWNMRAAVGKGARHGQP